MINNVVVLSKQNLPEGQNWQVAKSAGFVSMETLIRVVAEYHIRASQTRQWGLAQAKDYDPLVTRRFLEEVGRLALKFPQPTAIY